MIINKYGDVSPRVGARISRELLKEMQPDMVTQRFARKEQMRNNEGRTVIFRRLHNLPPARAPLVEGVTPAGQRITYTDVSAYLEEYGDIVVITNVIEDTHEDPLLNEMKSSAAGAAAQTVELATIDVLKSGTMVLYAGGSGATSRATVAASVSKGDLRRITRALHRNMAQPITQAISASPDVGTRPVERGFYAFCNSDLKADLRNIPGFLLASEYGNAKNVLPEEFGALEEIRFIPTQNFTPWAAAATSSAGTTYLSNGSEPSASAAPDVYPVIVVAKDAYGSVALQGMGAARITVINPKPSAADPIGQRGYVSWHLWHAAVILNDNWMCRYEVLVKANPS